MRLLLLLTLILNVLDVTAQTRVMVDGVFDDWTTITAAHSDATGDGGASGIDFRKVKIFNDNHYLLMQLETGVVMNLQDQNDLAVYIDIDNNSQTGSSINGIGADLVYTFGNRSGTYYLSSGGSTNIRHNSIGLVTAPTVTSSVFEIAVKREFVINGTNKSMSPNISVVFVDKANGDVMPDNNGISYSFTNGSSDDLPAYSIVKSDLSQLRIMSYNVERDGLFESSRQNAYTRIFKSTQPDIIGFQEIYNHTSKEVADHIEVILPSQVGEQWYHANAQPDCHAISRYPITKSAQIQGSGGSGNGAFLIDLPDTDRDMLLVVAHPPCCTNNVGRQMEVDLIMQFVREAKEGNGPVPINTNDYIVVLGDMNFVGDYRQVATLLSGDIVDETRYGSDFTPDWDGNDFIDAHPPTTGVPFSYTWYAESSSFSPGRLDYVIYSGSNMELQNSYTLFTPNLPKDSLTQYGLSTNDVVVASDHLPVVTDFTLATSNLNISSLPSESKFMLYPNPADETVNVAFGRTVAGLITIEWKDVLGKTIKVVHTVTTPTEEIQLKNENIPSGNYIVSISTKDDVQYFRLRIDQD